MWLKPNILQILIYCVRCTNSLLQGRRIQPLLIRRRLPKLRLSSLHLRIISSCISRMSVIWINTECAILNNGFQIRFAIEFHYCWVDGPIIVEITCPFLVLALFSLRSLFCGVCFDFKNSPLILNDLLLVVKRSILWVIDSLIIENRGKVLFLAIWWIVQRVMCLKEVHLLLLQDLLQRVIFTDDFKDLLIAH